MIKIENVNGAISTSSNYDIQFFFSALRIVMSCHATSAVIVSFPQTVTNLKKYEYIVSRIYYFVTLFRMFNQFSVELIRVKSLVFVKVAKSQKSFQVLWGFTKMNMIILSCKYVIKKVVRYWLQILEYWRFNSLFMNSPNYTLRNFNLLTY